MHPADDEVIEQMRYMLLTEEQVNGNLEGWAEMLESETDHLKRELFDARRALDLCEATTASQRFPPQPLGAQAPGGPAQGGVRERAQLEAAISPVQGPSGTLSLEPHRGLAPPPLAPEVAFLFATWAPGCLDDFPRAGFSSRIVF